MDRIVQGHGYAKAPFDAVFWDILGQATGQPVWMLLGGKLTDGAPMYRVAPQKPLPDTITEMAQHRAVGYRQFQIKVGGDWASDIERIRQTVPLLEPGEKAMADANRGWRVDNAIRIARAATDHAGRMRDRPARRPADRGGTRRGSVLPQNLQPRRAVQGAAHARFPDRNGIPVVCEDTWGGQITTAALAHLAASTPEDFLINATDLMNYNTRSTGIGGPSTARGRLHATDTPGLGVQPDYASLGPPVAIWETSP